jgi:hypothetical protein
LAPGWQRRLPAAGELDHRVGLTVEDQGGDAHAGQGGLAVAEARMAAFWRATASPPAVTTGSPSLLGITGRPD